MVGNEIRWVFPFPSRPVPDPTITARTLDKITKLPYVRKIFDRTKAKAMSRDSQAAPSDFPAGGVAHTANINGGIHLCNKEASTVPVVPLNKPLYILMDFTDTF